MKFLTFWFPPAHTHGWCIKKRGQTQSCQPASLANAADPVPCARAWDSDREGGKDKKKEKKRKARRNQGGSHELGRQPSQALGGDSDRSPEPSQPVPASEIHRGFASGGRCQSTSPVQAGALESGGAVLSRKRARTWQFRSITCFPVALAAGEPHFRGLHAVAA